MSFQRNDLFDIMSLFIDMKENGENCYTLLKWFILQVLK